MFFCVKNDGFDVEFGMVILDILKFIGVLYVFNLLLVMFFKSIKRLLEYYVGIFGY